MKDPDVLVSVRQKCTSSDGHFLQVWMVATIT
jgi:hypothetical protein